MFRALLYGQSIELTLPVFDLLRDAGFQIDYLSNQKRLEKHPSISNFFYVSGIENLPYVASEILNKKIYDLVIATDDVTLMHVKKSTLLGSEKLRLLPVLSEINFEHISSKINLSKVLDLGGIRNPKFRIVSSKEELINFFSELNFPLIIKGDISGGGTQTYKIKDELDLLKVADFFCHYPAVLQEYIDGKLIGIEAFYQNKELIYFNYSESLKTVRNNEFTPTSLRLFSQIGSLNNQLLFELKNLGSALGANGFVNVSAILSCKDKMHYFFEADMRPTVWVNSSKFCGNPASFFVKKYFLNGHSFKELPSVNDLFPIKFKLAYPPRTSFSGLFTNKYLFWTQLSEDIFLRKIVIRNFKHRILEILNLRYLRKSIRNFF
jgi:hypothetical protein